MSRGGGKTPGKEENKGKFKRTVGREREARGNEANAAEKDERLRKTNEKTKKNEHES